MFEDQPFAIKQDMVHGIQSSLQVPEDKTQELYNHRNVKITCDHFAVERTTHDAYHLVSSMSLPSVSSFFSTMKTKFNKKLSVEFSVHYMMWEDFGL